MQRLLFTIAVTFISRVLILRDRLLGRLRSCPEVPGVQVLRLAIPGGMNTLDSVLVAPVQPPQAALLICHGIGEIVDRWLEAQQLLAVHGVASLVFDYSGYGRSRGSIDWRTCEDNAVTAFSYLRTLVPAVPISLLGFSMGSGIAAAIVNRVPTVGLILCSAFPSFRDAACVLGLPRTFACVLPRIWCTRQTLPDCSVPVLIVHGERDRAFPIRMAREVASLCSGNADLVIVPGHAHNEAFDDPKMEYWSHVIGRAVPEHFHIWR